MDKAVSNYARKHYVNTHGLCDLCANTGMIDTTGAISADGIECGGRHFCLCAVGQGLRDAHAMHRAFL